VPAFSFFGIERHMANTSVYACGAPCKASVGLLIGAFLLFSSGFVTLHFPPWSAFLSEALSCIGAAIFLATWFITRLRQKAQQILLPHPALIIGAAVVCAWFILIARHDYFVTPIAVGFVYLVLFVLLSAAAAEGQVTGHLPLWALMLAFATAFNVVTECFSKDLWQAWFSGGTGKLGLLDRAEGPYFQSNHAATALLFGVAALTALCKEKLVRPAITLIACCGLIGCVVLTDSRGGYLALTLLCCALVALSATRKLPRLLGILGVSYLAALLTLRWLWYHVSHLFTQSDVRTIGVNTRGRTDAWLQLTAAVWEHAPWTGYGYMGVARAQNLNAHQFPAWENFSFAHNLVFDLLVWVGFPLAILTLVGLGLYALRLLRSIASMGVIESQWLFHASIAIVFFTSCLVEYHFAYAYFLLPFALSLGFLLKGHAWALSPVRISIGIAGGLLAVMLGGLIVYEYFPAERHHSEARARAARVGEFKLPLAHEPRLVLDQLEQLSLSFATPPNPAMSEEAIRRERMLVEHAPYGALQIRYVVLLLNNDRIGEAKRQMRVVERLQSHKWAEIGGVFCDLLHAEVPRLREVMSVDDLIRCDRMIVPPAMNGGW
jgi:Virulence factor membrane-bound polymerase, C-terminal/O-Antigen ligase